LEAGLKLLVEIVVGFVGVDLVATLLGLRPEPLCFEILLPGQALFSRILGNQSFGVYDVLHVVLGFHLLLFLFFSLPLLERALIEAEILNADSLAVLQGLSGAQIVFCRHLCAVLVAKYASLARILRHHV